MTEIIVASVWAFFGLLTFGWFLGKSDEFAKVANKHFVTSILALQVLWPVIIGLELCGRARRK